MSQHFILLRPSRRQVYLVGLSLGATTLFTTTRHHQRPQVLLCESSSSSSSSSSSKLSRPLQRISQHRREGGREEKAILWKEISSGSILGLVSGIAISAFSKPLTILFGLALLAVQLAASKGINIIPTAKLQKYIMGINIRSALQEHLAFKVSFGTGFLLAGWGSF